MINCMDEYVSIEKVVYKIAWRWHRLTGIDFEELHSEARYQAMRAITLHDPSRSKLITFAWRVIDNRLNLFVKKEYKNKSLPAPDKEFTDKEIFFIKKDEIISNLSGEGREVLDILLKDVDDLLSLNINKQVIVKHLRSYGFVRDKATSILKEIGEVIKIYASF